MRIVLIFTLVASLFACKKVTKSVESDLIAGDVALKTISNCESAVIGAYGGLGVEMNILLNSTLSDEVATAGEFYNAATTHEWLYTNADVGIRDNFTAINPLYRIIDRANRVLNVIGTATAANAADEAKRPLLRGEALFLRAWAHFELYRFYGAKYSPTGLAMPYMKTVSIDPQARIQSAPYFASLNDDITAAKALLPNTLTDKNRANVATANGLHARVALYSEDWANAETYATNYINALPLSPQAQFVGLWRDANTNEVSFQLIRTISVGGRIGSLYRGTSASTANIGTVTWKPSSKLWNMYDQVNDVRFVAYLRDEPFLTAASRQSRIVNKYPGSGIATTNENLNNAKVFRTGEMYLIRAEARASKASPDLVGATADLNTLRAARITGYVNVPTYGSATTLIADVMDERFKELPFEGHRFWDLKRRGLPVVRLAGDAPTPASVTLPANSTKFPLPIPLTELQANNLMVQNPGY